jgi:hypothetical protein
VGFCPAHAGNLRIDSLEIKKKCFLDAARHEATFVREATNQNDHPAIVGYFDAIGMNVRKFAWQGRAYCGAFIGAMMKRCGIKNPIVGPAQTVNWLKDKTRVTRVRPGTVAQPGDVAGYNFSGRKTGIDHVEIVSNWHPNPGFPYTTVIGANTGAPKGAAVNRQGVWVKDRLKRQVVWIIRVFDPS